MKTAYIAGVVALVVILGGGWWYSQMAEAPEESAVVEYPTAYAYTCADGSGFQVVFAQDMSSIIFAPSEGSAFPGGELAQAEAESGALFTNGTVSFAGRGETVTIAMSEVQTTCAPLLNTEEPPFNFGD